MAKNLSIVAQGISGDEGKLLGYNVTDNGIYTPAIGDVARDTTATYVAQDGTIKTAAENVARVDYTNGVAELLLEPESTNLIQNSEPTSAEGASGGVTYESFNWANGFTNCVRFENGSDGFWYGGVCVTNTINSISFYVKMDDSSLPNVGSSNSSGDFSVILSGSFASNVKIVQETNDIYRISGNFAVTTSATSANGIVKYSGQSSKGFRVVGFQLEQQPYATSYIPTNGAIATRGADSLTNFGSEQIIDSESGILFFEGSVPTDEDSVWVALTNDSNSTTTLSIGFEIGGAIRTYSRNNLGVIYTDAFTPLQTINSTYKFYLKYNETNVEFGVIGYYSNQSNSFPIYGSNSFTQLTLSRTSSLPFYGRVRQVKHLPYNTDITTL